MSKKHVLLKSVVSESFYFFQCENRTGRCYRNHDRDSRPSFRPFLFKKILEPQFSKWRDWTACSSTCTAGKRSRSRTCTSACYNINENDYNHRLSETEDCNLQLLYYKICGESEANFKRCAYYMSYEHKIPRFMFI